MTKGTRSSEFWMTIATMATGAVLHQLGASLEVIALICGVGISYVTSRGIAKHGNNGS